MSELNRPPNARAALLCALPFILTVCVPLLGLIVAVFAGHMRWFDEGQRFVNAHSAEMTVLSFVAVPPVLWGVYLTWGRSVLHQVRLTRNAKLMNRFAPDYNDPRPLPMWVYAFLASWVGIACIVGWQLLRL